MNDKILHIIHYDGCRGLWGDAVRLAAESLGISDVFWNILIPLAPRTALVCTILKKTTTYLWFMVCNSIPGHPLGFSPSVSGLPDFGMLDRSPCSAVSAKKIRIPQAGVLEFSVCCEQRTSSGGSRILLSSEVSPQGINICTSGGHHTSQNFRDSVHFIFEFWPGVTKNHHDSQRMESNSFEHLQHPLKAVIKCPVMDQMAVALEFRGASFCSIRRSSDKTENGLLLKMTVTNSSLCIWFFFDIFASVQGVIVQAFSFGTVSSWMEEKP